MLPAPLNGVINLHKPAGISSARAVDRVKRLLPRGTKIGHAGTLDPFATGVLLLLVGRATKLCETLMGQPKQYAATIKLGATTATLDPESPEEPWPGMAPGDAAGETLPEARTLAALSAGPVSAGPVSADVVRSVLPRFVGEILQMPPAFSALKVAGRRAYDLARRGEAVALEPRLVRVYGIELLSFAWPLLRLKLDCGRGTYVRALARDVGQALGAGGYLTELCRTRIGAYGLADAVSLERLAAEGVDKHLDRGATEAG